MKPDKAARLDQIHAILSNHRHPIRSIQILAQEYGFDDLAEFNKAFKARFGNSPVAIRKMAKNPGGRGRRR